MMRGTALGLAVLTCGCGLVPIGDDGSVVALVVANRRVDEVVLTVEQPNGETARFPYQPCSSHSEPLDGPWQLEVGAIVALTSDDVEPIPGAPFTVVQVDLLPDGEIRISDPIASRTMPDVPIAFACG